MARLKVLSIAVLLTAPLVEGEAPSINVAIRRVLLRPEQSTVAIQIQNKYKKELATLGVAYSVLYGPRDQQTLAAMTDCAIPPASTRYVSFALPEISKGARAVSVGDVRVTFVILGDNTAAGDEELVSQTFERRKEDAAELNRWAPEFEAAARAADPVAAMAALAIRLSGETDDPAILGAISGMQKALQKMAESWVQASGRGRTSIIEIVRRMQQSAAAHSRRR